MSIGGLSLSEEVGWFSLVRAWSKGESGRERGAEGASPEYGGGVSVARSRSSVSHKPPSVPELPLVTPLTLY